jgi:hypothetical protein
VPFGLKPFILPQSEVNSESVRSEVQHFADAAVLLAYGLNGVVHLGASVVLRMFVVCRSHCAWRVAAYKLFVFCERDIAFDGAGALAASSFVGLQCGLGEL